MSIDLSAVSSFMATHARLLDRRRFGLRLGEYVPADGRVRVEGGTEEETLRPLDFAPLPDRPARALFTQEVIDADLDRLAGLQRDDGGWTVDYATISPAGALDWRGYTTVQAMDVLRRNGRL
ncbi:hypothetical protein AB0D67_08845 [Streptosporangium sp. NPDC048047]|uniref:hypothetical protein n=1 Tax=Streptosporangium sp. NPDC048047 TaxID=3155748 RepID=UPI00343D582E